MKDFIIKHPFITLVLIEDAFICIENCVTMITGVKKVKTHTVSKVMNSVSDFKKEVTE